MELKAVASLIASRMESAAKGIKTLMRLRFVVKRIFAVVELHSLLVVGQNFFRRGDVHELLLGCLLLRVCLKVVGMPLLGQSSVSFRDFLLGGSSLNSQDLVVIALLGLLLRLPGNLHSLLGSIMILINAMRFLVVAICCCLNCKEVINISV